ncbi:MAG: bifunctional DNA-formamidopyrimidine glycosylase/DNA-(apurinic or apyrimidinic site) lyase [Candidatus Glassbacteria bacterium]|nr:bifunctional DNA-formamidopyrimidine glycosylase/DNA-(apurinic or apyrimidinic site) lyase [Candidatus Glassbacteria bacterium]
MPELPEVETVVRQLAPFLLGRRVCCLEILDPKLESPEKDSVGGRTILEVVRAGKQAVIRLSPLPGSTLPLWLSFHLRMTGRLIMDGWQSGQQEKHLRARLVLDRGCLNFFDVRRFGVIDIRHSPGQVRPQGLDPLSPAFTGRALAKLLCGPGRQVKPWLLRQDRLAGIGNIYASEILFHAGIDPRREVAGLTAEEIKHLHHSTRKVLRLAIENCGTTFSDFQDTRGRAGTFQDLLSVYRREAQPCRRCGEPVVRIVQQQRSTFFCPACQR